jgi:FAD/FMN-containing dehydrogenase
MNRVLKIDKDTVTVQPGISLPDLAEVLAEEGLELIGGFDLASRTVGGAVCAAGLEASMAGDVSQFASYAVQLKVLSPSGKRFVVSERTKSLLALMRLSYGLLGVIYEITLRVRPIQGFAVQTAKVGFKDFGKLGGRCCRRLPASSSTSCRFATGSTSSSDSPPRRVTPASASRGA